MSTTLNKAKGQATGARILESEELNIIKPIRNMLGRTESDDDALPRLTLSVNKNARMKIARKLMDELALEAGDHVAFALHPKKQGSILMAYVPNPNSTPCLKVTSYAGKGPKDESKKPKNTYGVSPGAILGALGIHLPEEDRKEGRKWRWNMDKNRTALAYKDHIWYVFDPVL
jgi:hypothetical protein